MKMRIVLSVILLLVLAALAAACPSAGTTNPGIGTSPSGPTADDQADDIEGGPVDHVSLPVTATALLPACGIWVAQDEATAEGRAQADEPPNDVMFAFGDTTCSDALAISAQRWPGRSVVYYAEQVWRRAR